MPKFQDLVIYLIVRKDLKMGVGKIAAQCGHAVEDLILNTEKVTLRKYHKNAHPKIVLRVDSLETLQQIHRECLWKNYPCHLVEDAGFTQIPAGSFTVLGIGPIERNSVEIIRELKLF